MLVSSDKELLGRELEKIANIEIVSLLYKYIILYIIKIIHFGDNELVLDYFYES